MNDQEIAIIKKTIELSLILEKSDSKSETLRAQTELYELNSELIKFNGRLVEYRGRLGRPWYQNHGKFKVYRNSRFAFRRSDNYDKIYLDDNIKFIEEDNSELIRSISEIDEEIRDLQEKINLLESKKDSLSQNFVVFVDPNSFKDTEDNEEVSFCKITGVKVYG